jgi:hypothetical protein
VGVGGWGVGVSSRVKSLASYVGVNEVVCWHDYAAGVCCLHRWQKHQQHC